MKIYFTEKEHRAFERLMKGKPGFDHYDSKVPRAGHTGLDGRTASVNIRSALSRPDAVPREQALKEAKRRKTNNPR